MGARRAVDQMSAAAAGTRRFPHGPQKLPSLPAGWTRGIRRRSARVRRTAVASKRAMRIDASLQSLRATAMGARSGFALGKRAYTARGAGGLAAIGRDKRGR